MKLVEELQLLCREANEERLVEGKIKDFFIDVRKFIKKYWKQILGVGGIIVTAVLIAVVISRLRKNKNTTKYPGFICFPDRFVYMPGIHYL